MATDFLTPKEKLFCKLLLESGDIQKSYNEAGYIGKDSRRAYAMAERPKVKAYLKAAQKALLFKDLASVEWKMGKLVKITENTEEEKPNIAISAISELNKMQGHYAPVQTQTLNLNSDIDLDQLKDIALKIKDF